jgi:hypothetical protein
MNACRRVSNLSEQDIDKALKGIGDNFWKSEAAIFNNEEEAKEYFCNRLAVWKSCFPLISKVRAA